MLIIRKLWVFWFGYIPRTFMPLLNCKDFLTANWGALVMLASRPSAVVALSSSSITTSTFFVTVWIWVQGEKRYWWWDMMSPMTQGNSTVSDQGVCVLSRKCHPPVPVGNKPAPGSPGTGSWSDQRRHPSWTRHRSSRPRPAPPSVWGCQGEWLTPGWLPG